ncbi:MAG TPA: copper amine oxidase N-terminal domain-containing protein [Clostridiaceae bacterium]|nr:copper amine oxidase N-terminal domain-containing protein [Clostridiaceae bacterium]
MKKMIFSFVVCIFVFSLSAFFAYAEDEIVEVPDLKIIIDGKLTEQRDVPISKNQRTLLPLRELAEKLGVPNDDEHIIWNNKEKSVTIIKDSTKIYLKQGDKTAYINDTPVELDVAPVGYINSRTYIPFRFLAEALGKKVVWDGNTKSIFVCDTRNYEKVKEIVQKSDEVMRSFNKTSVDANMNIDMSNKFMWLQTNMSMSFENDSAAKKKHIVEKTEFMGQEMINESYFDEKYVYSFVPDMNVWVKQDIEEVSTQGVFESSGILSAGNEIYNDILFTSMKVVEVEEASGFIVLEGNTYPGYFIDGLVKNLQDILQDEFQLNHFYCRMYIDENTFCLDYMEIEVEYSIPMIFGDIELLTNVDIHITVEFDYGDDIIVEIPEEIIENAIEINSTEE